MELEKAYMLAEAKFELGGKDPKRIGYQVTNVVNIKDNTGGMRDMRLIDIPPKTRATVEKVVRYLKKERPDIYKKIALKYDTKTPDIEFNADSSATINFDGGGSEKIPASTLNKVCKNY